MSRLAGREDRYGEYDDATVVISAGRWAAVAAHAEARKLLALAEMIRRFPDSAKRASAGDMPAVWEFGLAEQAGLELAVSPGSADNDLAHAWALAVRLPATLAALRDGIIDAAKARMIGRETSVLSDEDARAADARLAAWGCAGKTWSQIQAKLSRIVVNIDPDAAQRRREQAQRDDARVRFWREASGTGALAAYGLPPDEALQAHSRVQHRAEAYRKAGLDGSMDLLRAKAYLDILNGTDSRDDLAAAQDTLDHASRDDDSDVGDDGTGDDGTGDDGTGDGGTGGQDGYGDGVAANLDLTLPLSTLLGLGERAGEAGQFGTIDPALVRNLATAAVQNLRTTIRIIITGPDGRAAGFGIAKERKKRSTGRGNPPPSASAPPPRSSGQPAMPAHDGMEFRFGPAPGQQQLPLDGDGGGGGKGEGVGGGNGEGVGGGGGAAGTMSGWGTWRLAAAGREWDIQIVALPAPGPCAHQYRTGRHDPGPVLRALVQVRDGQCALPVCGHAAPGAEWEHCIPWPQEPGTCACNGGIHCKRHHRVKDQAKGWSIIQLADGRRRWMTPAGLTYTSRPRQYPD